MRFNKLFRKVFAAVSAVTLIVSGMPVGLGVTAFAADTQTRKITYSFSANSSKKAPAAGEILDGTAGESGGILYVSQDAGNSGVTYDSDKLRFRQGSVLYLPVKDDTTKVKYEQLCSNAATDRPVYIGSADSGYSVQMKTTTQSVTVDDITGYIVEKEGQKYLPVISGGDVKIRTMALTEYNPIINVTVTGTVANAAENGITEIKFDSLTDSSAKTVTAQVDSNGKYSVVLKRVNGSAKYEVSISAVGFKINDTDNGNILELTGENATAVKDFEAVADAVATVSGSIMGIPADAVKGTVSVKFVPDNSKLSTIAVDVKAQTDGSYSFSNVSINSSSNYSVVLGGVDDYEVTEKLNKAAGDYTDVQIAATQRVKVNVSGKFVTSDDKASDVTKITFTNKSDSNYSYSFDVTGDGYKAQLRAGEYDTSVVSEKYTAYDHVSVGSSDVLNDVYLETEADTSPVKYQSEVKVGKGQQFETITDAVKYIGRMARTTERVTITLTDALYREQVMVDTPYVTISSEAGSTITWYYGSGYTYYSADMNGYYSEARAVDKYEKGVAIGMGTGHWGATVNVLPTATAFRSEGVIYESSFNRYMTTEEVEDGVGKGGDNSKVDRSKATDADIKLYKNKERACVIFIEADQSEFKDCQFLSSQDTMFTGNNTEHTYFKNCVIEGTTDYICGDGSAVFDGCTLSMYGYGDKAASGSIIVASKALSQLGYLFNNCKVVKTSYPGINKGITKTYFARPWRADSKVVFLNTEVEDANTIAPAGFTSMSNVTPAKAKYYEYNTHLADGTKVSTSSRAAGVNKMTDEEASAVKLEDYFEGWTPTYYTSGDVKPEPVAADYTAVDEAIKAAEALNKDDYEDFSAVTKAIEAVDRTLTSEDQAKVDAMAKAITDAINGLVKKQPVVEPDDPGKTDIKVDIDRNEDAADFKDIASVGDVKVKDEEGKDLTVSEIKLNVEKAAASISEKIDAAIADKNINGFDSKNADYYDISLKTTDGKVVKLSNGKIKITMSYKKGINAADYNLYVFHMNNNGVLESVAVTADENGFSFEAESFSPYAVVYAVKDSGSDITPSTPENPGNDETPGTTETPGTPGTTETPDSSVSTGDSLGMFMYMIILAAALAGMAGVVVNDRKRAK
ncbi:pectinesterase family protein [Lachnospira hominis (ex Hitch et al. 2024)]|uniref:Pectinesterase family protein n=1 Tax=Lachnospira intestinalis TaxID=3133158 RepID=A0ABV1GLP1_9FIRM